MCSQVKIQAEAEERKARLQAEEHRAQMALEERNLGGRLPEGCVQQAVVGPQGSGGTLNPLYSARELLKALVSNES